MLEDVARGATEELGLSDDFYFAGYLPTDESIRPSGPIRNDLWLPSDVSNLKRVPRKHFVPYLRPGQRLREPATEDLLTDSGQPLFCLGRHRKVRTRSSGILQT